jgi:EAL domain-containing protein (putative c-di-GMP-specific phosphodiesterase class I)
MENDLAVWTLDDASTHNLLLEIQRTTPVGYDEAKAVFDRLRELGFYVARPDVVAPEVVGN